MIRAPVPIGAKRHPHETKKPRPEDGAKMRHLGLEPKTR